ncbi:MAG: hypothetical protein LBQ80_00035 [Clostridium sp.]|nr:hypothetical protein [Clostridium sp.]
MSATKIKPGEPVSLKAAVARATAIMFVFQLFGALGAGFIFVVSNILGIEIVRSSFWEVFWHLCFWATDFAFVCFTLVLAYLIAGIPAIAPALTLSLWFSHFAGLYDGAQISAPLYTDFFTPPQDGAGGWNIGYLGFLFIALGIGYGIRWLYTLWHKIKQALAPKIDKPLAQLTAKLKPLKDLKAIALLDGIDLIVLILILPIVVGLAVYFWTQYCVAVPFKALGETLEPVMTELFASGKNFGGGLLMGLLVGADTIGPLSMAGFRAATEAAQLGNAVPMTAFAFAFAATGWVSFGAFLLNKISKRGGKMDTDDMNLALSGPINAIFDNMKLTVAFGIPFAYRSPLSVIPGTIITCAVTAALSCAAGISNALYVQPEYVAKFSDGDYYTSFAQPYLKLGENNHPFLSLVFISCGVIVGSVVVVLIRELIARRQKQGSGYEETDGDIVLEMRELSALGVPAEEEAAESLEPQPEPDEDKPLPKPKSTLNESDFAAWLAESQKRFDEDN